MDKQGYTYILASKKHGTLYIGVTSDLVKRTWEHREDQADGFTRKYGVQTLVHFESFDDIKFAIEREKQLKRWHRQWKINLIEEHNPDWEDLYPSITA
ncbi:GIY-YIG nuclease family protein [Kordiimonas sp.]|uniref:GIY-YIG nuclease family protein n=1 Tax=Kordiimonas sp. TaxID=1970157 RepID=UPI003A8CA7E0